MPRRPVWLTDVLILEIFVMILAVLSVVTVTTLRQAYDQNEKLQTVNRFVDCLDPTTPCGKKLAAHQAAEREFLAETMRSQAICTLLTSRTLRGTDDMTELERVYHDCVQARAAPPPPEPPESPVVDEDEEN